MLSEISHTEKDKYHMVSLIHGIKKKKKNRNRLIENKLVIARGEVFAAGLMSEIGEAD